MILSKAFEKFVDGSPVAVMIRGSLEHALPAEFVNRVFETTAKRQYTRSLLFSDVVDVMGNVVCQVFPTVNAAYKKHKKQLTVSRESLYGKINHVEPRVTRQLLVQSAGRLGPVVLGLQRRADRKRLVPGFKVRILDGNHLAATDHRIAELRDIAAGPLPGQALAVYDPDLRLIVDLFLCEDGHAQERSLLVDVLDTQESGELWICDRNFCTSLFLFQTAANRAFFLVRQHARNVRWEPTEELRKVGDIDSGSVYQQRVDLIDKLGDRISVRRITIRLDKPTADGDEEIHLLTNLPNRVIATRIAQVNRSRWKLEGAFGKLATALSCEISSLGYPPAALFAFGVGAIAYNILSVVRTAIQVVHRVDADDISAYYVADEIRGMMRGMMVAVPDQQWERQFGNLTARQMVTILLALAVRVDIEAFRKNRRGPKKPRPPRTRYKGKGHVSTARILQASRGRTICMQ